MAIGFRTLRRYWRTHTIKSGDLTPFLRHWSFRIKSEDLTPFLHHWSFRIKTVLNNQCGSVHKVLSVRHRRPRFARPPIGVRRDRLSDGTRILDGTYFLTHTIKTVLNDQCGSVRKVLSVRRRRPRFARPPGAFGPTPADSLRSSANRGSSRLASGWTGKDVLTHTIKSEDLTPFLRN